MSMQESDTLEIESQAVSYELPDMGAENQTRVLYKSCMHSTAEPSLLTLCHIF